MTTIFFLYFTFSTLVRSDKNIPGSSSLDTSYRRCTLSHSARTHTHTPELTNCSMYFVAVAVLLSVVVVVVVDIVIDVVFITARAAITPSIKNSSRKFHSSLHSIVIQLCLMECKEVWSDRAYATEISFVPTLEARKNEENSHFRKSFLSSHLNSLNFAWVCNKVAGIFFL